MSAATQTHSTDAMLHALGADAPAPDHAEELLLYGQFVGEWEFDWTGYDENGRPSGSERGEWIFAWVLEGRAVQDVWIVPERARRGEPGRPVGEYGTTLRFYDPELRAWKVTWHGPVQGARRTFVARSSGDEIVQEGHTDAGDPLRWIFSEITNDSFNWRSVFSTDGAATWRLREKMTVRRKVS